MKTKTLFSKITKASYLGVVSILISLSLLNTGCRSNSNEPTERQSYVQVNLVSDIAGFNAARTDVNLGNPWGIAIGPTGSFWISANHTGSTVIYDASGNPLLAPINIPLGAAPNGSSPTGVIYNGTADFAIPIFGTSTFIYATEDGILSAWNSNTGTTTVTVVDNSSTGAVYKGLTMANDGGANFIYVTDFHNAKIAVFDRNFAPITTKPFSDPTIPTGFAPFNIQNIDGLLYVTYAKQLAPDFHDDEAGLGNGFIDIYTPGGIFVKRFASNGTLNSPWGVTKAPESFGQGDNIILVGNFGDGHINVFKNSGVYLGQLQLHEKIIAIPGLWDITFNSIAPSNPSHLYFTAGPNSEADGVFGYLRPE